MTELPVTHLYDFGSLSQAGAAVHIVLKPDALEKLAQWAGVKAVDSFTADFALQKLSQNRFSFDLHWSADVVQSCVVTLEPVKSHLSGELKRELNLVRRPRRGLPEPEMPLPELDEDGPEEIESPVYDLAMPLLEDFALAIDPYPRKPGVMFESPAIDAEKPESPFAALKILKTDR